jgi:hypothetical protein
VNDYWQSDGGTLYGGYPVILIKELGYKCGGRNSGCDEATYLVAFCTVAGNRLA